MSDLLDQLANEALTIFMGTDKKPRRWVYRHSDHPRIDDNRKVIISIRYADDMDIFDGIHIQDANPT